MSVNVGYLLSTTLGNYSKELEDSVTEDLAFMRYLDKEGAIVKESGGEKLYENIEYDEAGYSWFSNWDHLNTTPSAPFDVSQYEWKTIAVPISLNGTDIRKNQGNKTQIVNLVTSTVRNAEHTIKNQVAAALYSLGTGNDGKEVVGLQAAVPDDPTTGTYGNINRATSGNEFWQTKRYRAQTTGGVAALSSANIVQMLNRLWALVDKNGVSPQIGLADSDAFTMYEDHCQALQRLMKPSEASVGFDAYRYKNCDIIRDSSMPTITTTRLYLVTCGMRGLRLKVHKDLYFSDLGGKREAWSQDATIRYLGFMGNLTMRSARHCGVLLDS